MKLGEEATCRTRKNSKYEFSERSDAVLLNACEGKKRKKERFIALGS